ncbi:uncharacterized protein LOC114527074 [Dendronephthya gigantea]|uniref:uncharacterized protein LOC114527074 n=1 Tax=Dendronephthya gigantea TaxID=151771 RepID=UPI00106AC377|nr:uncharacterized protein LOC114527074 [Dendronephthya gigantea]
MSRTYFYHLFCFNILFVFSKSLCCETKCSLFKNENDLSKKFQLSLAEEGVRIVYLRLDANNVSDGYNSMHSDRIMHTRWTWAQSNSEPLLSVSYDYDVLSLGLLKNQVKDLTLEMTLAQKQCLEASNSTFRDEQTARALLNITNKKYNKDFTVKHDVVCFRLLREHWFGIGSHFKYKCCKERPREKNKNGTSIDCNVPVNESRWLAVFNAILAILVTVTVLYWPWIFYLLPDSFFTTIPVRDSQTQAEEGTACKATVDTISARNTFLPLDDFSPITLQTLLQKFGDMYPKNMFDIRVKLFLVWFGFIPLFFYIKLLLYFIIKGDNFDETSSKLLFQIADFYLFVFKMKKPLVYVLFIMPFFVIPCLAIFLVPTKIGHQSVIEANKKSKEKIKRHLKVEILRITNVLLRVSTCNIFGKFACCKTSIASLCSVVHVLVVFPICTLVAVVFSIISSISCLAIFSPYLVFLCKLLLSNKSSLHYRIFMFYSTISATIVVTFSCQFVVRMLGFVIMGIILNAEYVVPYLTFAFVVTSNINHCICNTQKKYKELKSMIARPFKTSKDDDTIKTIPKELFWSVSKKVLPISNEIFLLVGQILAILVFLSIALVAILLFNVTYGPSAIVSTISVFISGKFSELFFTRITSGSEFAGWDKIDLETEITSELKELHPNIPAHMETETTEI